MTLRHLWGHARLSWQPNAVVSRPVMLLIVGVQVAMLATWWRHANPLVPRPHEVAAAFVELWRDGLAWEVAHSLAMNLRALFWSTVISLALAYLTVLPLARPVIAVVTKFRFLGLVGLTLIFTLMTGGGQALTLSVLTFGMTVFFVTAMAAEIEEIPGPRFDHARTLRMGEWRVVGEVVVLGRADAAFEVLRQNAAIAWMMLTMVEGLVRSGGGVGVLLLNENKHLNLAAVLAIQLVILAVGLGQDAAIGWLQGVVCPYSRLQRAR